MKIIIGKVEGQTDKKGTKQNIIYTLTKKFPNDVWDGAEKWYDGISETGKKVIIRKWDNNWSSVGIQSKEKGRMSYTKDFQLIDQE